MKLDREAYMQVVKTLIGDNTSDEAITMLENLTDTYDGLSKSADTDWEAKYNEAVAENMRIDEEWRKRYTDRFYSAIDEEEDELSEPAEQMSTEVEPAEPTIDDIAEAIIKNK